MLTDFCLFSHRITRSVLYFCGACLVLFSISALPAGGQDPQNEIPFSIDLESIQYQRPLGETNLAFFEFSGSQDRDDPLEDFPSYLLDPINWDLAEPAVSRMVYHTHTGFQTHQRILGGTSVLRFGFETELEHTRVYTLPRSTVVQSNSEQHHNLVDVLYAPYLFLESHPLSWIRMFGNLKLNVQAFDVQHVCRTTCSLEPKGQGTDMLPSVMGGLLLGPLFNTQIFINIGKGSYQFDEREPVGSTAQQQFNRTRFLEFGFLSNPSSQIEIRGSLWGTKNHTDFAYNLDAGKFKAQGPSQRYGLNLYGKIRLPNQTALTGGFTFSRNTFRQTPQPFPLTPRLAGRAALLNNWNSNWSTTLQWQYIGKRRTNNQLLPAFHTLDFLAHYHYPMHYGNGHLTVSLGILNVQDQRSPYSLYYFDSGLTPANNPAIDLNYFPGQPRAVVSSISWLF